MTSTNGFSGWKQVFLLFLMYVSTTVSTNCLPFFFPTLKTTFGWTNEQVSQPASYYFIYIAFFSPLIGWMLSKFKPTAIMLVGILLGLASMIAYANFTTFWQYHLIYIALSLSITMSGLLPSMVIINNWFSKYRGRAVGIFLLGSSVGGILFPRLATHYIAQSGWRTAALVVGAVSFFLSIVPYFWVKNHPQALGQWPDGLPPFRQAQARTTAPTSISVGGLFRSPVFYLLVFITASFWFCGFGVLQHLPLYLKENQFSIQEASNVSTIFFICSIIGKISFGYLSDTFNKMNILILATGALIVGIACLKLVAGYHNAAYLFGVVYGIGYSGAFAMIQLSVAEIYKGPAFGRVLGLVNAIDSVGGFAGVSILGIMSTAQGSYAPAMTVLLSVVCAAFGFAIVLRWLRKHQLQTS